MQFSGCPTCHDPHHSNVKLEEPSRLTTLSFVFLVEMFVTFIVNIPRIHANSHNPTSYGVLPSPHLGHHDASNSQPTHRIGTTLNDKSSVGSKIDCDCKMYIRVQHLDSIRKCSKRLLFKPRYSPLLVECHSWFARLTISGLCSFGILFFPLQWYAPCGFFCYETEGISLHSHVIRYNIMLCEDNPTLLLSNPDKHI